LVVTIKEFRDWQDARATDARLGVTPTGAARQYIVPMDDPSDTPLAWKKSARDRALAVVVGYAALTGAAWRESVATWRERVDAAMRVGTIDGRAAWPAPALPADPFAQALPAPVVRPPLVMYECRACGTLTTRAPGEWVGDCPHCWNPLP
jgi:hypothetical protein